MAQQVLKCAQCGREGDAPELMPYLVKGRKRSKVYRWLCGLHTGRPCSTEWHRRYREWLASQTSSSPSPGLPP